MHKQQVFEDSTFLRSWAVQSWGGSGFILVEFPVSECANYCEVPCSQGMLRMRCFEKCCPRTMDGWCRKDRSVIVVWCWGAKFTLSDLVVHGHAEKLMVSENNLQNLIALCCVSNKCSKWRKSRYFSLCVAIKMYLLILAFLIRGNGNANPGLFWTIYTVHYIFRGLGGCWLRLIPY